MSGLVLFDSLYPIPQVVCSGAELFEYEVTDSEHCGTCDAYTGLALTPRNALMLLWAAQALEEEVVQRVSYGSRDLVYSFLPAIAHGLEDAFYLRFASCFGDLGARLVRGHGCWPQTSAEELALAAMVGRCGTFDLKYLELCSDFAALPDHPNDGDWVLLEEVLFLDHDVRLLFDYWLPLPRGALDGWFRPFC